MIRLLTICAGKSLPYVESADSACQQRAKRFVYSYYIFRHFSSEKNEISRKCNYSAVSNAHSPRQAACKRRSNAFFPRAVSAGETSKANSGIVQFFPRAIRCLRIRQYTGSECRHKNAAVLHRVHTKKTSPLSERPKTPSAPYSVLLCYPRAFAILHIFNR